MAKTEEEIVKELEESISTSDPTLDVKSGPIVTTQIRPQAGRLANASREAENTRQLFTLNFENVITEFETRSALANFGSSPGGGQKARHVQYFLKFTKPTQDVEIPAGTVVGNADGSFTYTVINTGTIFRASANSFFNPARNAYEIGLEVEANGVGEEFELAPFRINTIISPLSGVDTTENRRKPEGGESAESLDSQASRLKNALLGLNKSAPGGIRTLINNNFSSIVTDVAVIQPYEEEFVRNVTGPALDIYVIGNDFKTHSETFTAIAGQTDFILSKVPVQSVSTVQVNGVDVDFTFIQDTDKETGLSLNAIDIVNVDATLIAGDVVTVDYIYNALIENINNTVFEEDEPFDTDVLIRSPFKVNPKITATVRILPSFSTTEIENDITAFFEGLFAFTTFREIVQPEIVRQEIRNEISGIQSLTFSEFRRNTGSLADIEPMIFARNEVSEFNSTFIDIKVVK